MNCKGINRSDFKTFTPGNFSIKPYRTAELLRSIKYY
jgi:hypothetical protein